MANVSNDFLAVINAIPVDALIVMSNSGLAFEINDGLVINMIKEKN